MFSLRRGAHHASAWARKFGREPGSGLDGAEGPGLADFVCGQHRDARHAAGRMRRRARLRRPAAEEHVRAYT
ncbi:hypothetical protein BIU87_13630 [Streptomyces sp. ZS0098]|nr:hypothetical protein BIU87_13630 [Streptomyces sp. ZS0098]